MSESFARDVLLKLKWTGSDLDRATVVIRSRGGLAPTANIHGSTLSRIGRSFMTFDDGTMVPFHRVETIIVGKDIVWSRHPLDEDIEDHHMLGG